MVRDGTDKCADRSRTHFIRFILVRIDFSSRSKIISLLCYALYPNVCFHLNKRKLLTAEGKEALIHKNSVNCGKEIPTFPSPFFVFTEKVKNILEKD